MPRIFELSSYRLTKSEWTRASHLDYLFSDENPWLVEKDTTVIPVEKMSSKPEEYRSEMLTGLKQALPEGYEVHGQRITVKDPGKYWKAVVEKMKRLAKEAVNFNLNFDPETDETPLHWWKKGVDEQGNILVYFKDYEELMTLNEFLLFMIEHKADYGFLYIGGIYSAYDREL